MCGIAVLATTAEHHDADTDGLPHLCALFPSVRLNNLRRGPDQDATITLDFATGHAGPTVHLTLSSSVLGLRGEKVTAQPLTSDDGRFALAWNGQVFDWQEASPLASSSKLRLDSGDNDGGLLFNAILTRIRSRQGEGQDSANIVIESVREAFAEVEGPYAFAFVDRQTGSLIYGRDQLGRRSLLAAHDAEQGVMLASVSSLEAVEAGLRMAEVDCASLWTIDLCSSPLVSRPLQRQSPLCTPLRLHELEHPSSSSEREESNHGPRSMDDRLASAAAFEAVLERAIEPRVTNIRTRGRQNEAHVAILFSGGLDCATLARLADRFVPPEQPIDLLNVGFENPRSIQAARTLAEQTRAKAAKMRERSGGAKARSSAAASNDVLARPPPVVEVEVDIYDVPDRLTGRATHAELCKLSPQRVWNFVEINVPYTEYCEARKTVEALMHPTDSVMDLSIASALYFAARGRGHISDASTKQRSEYTTPARVLISGLGADELLGGYSRHRHAFERGGWIGLVDELQMDLDRLPTRNLGRDDRILSTWGRESRYPYLSRNVIAYLCSLPVYFKTDPRLNIPSPSPTIRGDKEEEGGGGGGGGDKLLLRDLAASPGVGLKNAARLRKRAMQFGTRAAKMEAGMRRVKGHEKLD